MKDKNVNGKVYNYKNLLRVETINDDNFYQSVA